MNDKNLIPNSKRTPSELREQTSKGGKKSGESRRRKRDMKAKMKMLLELPCCEAGDWNEASAMGVDISDIDNEMVMLIGLYKKAKTGDVSAIREVRNIAGKDISSEELSLKKQELELKKKQLSGDNRANDLVKDWMEAVQDNEQ